MKKVLFCWIILFCFPIGMIGSEAMHMGLNNRLVKREKTILQLYVDSIQKASDKYYTKVYALGSVDYKHMYVKMNPYMYKMFTPFTFYSSLIRKKFSANWQPSLLKKRVLSTDTLLSIHSSILSDARQSENFLTDVLTTAYLVKWDKVLETEFIIEENEMFDKNRVEKIKPRKRILELFNGHYKKPKNEVDERDYKAKRPNFWRKYGDGSLQFTQNYFSSNWYKGGESTNALLSNLSYHIDYDDKQRIEFDNALEIKQGFITTPSDTVHTYKSNADLLRISSKFGIRAFKDWYYTLEGELSTQFFSNYKTNSNTIVSTFLSPANLNIGLGMDYKKVIRNVTLSVLLSPISYHMRYVGSSDVDETTFGLEEGQSVLNEVGSKLQVVSKIQLLPQITWESRLYYFTVYSKVEAEWENTFNFVLNQYLSTKLFFNARFDDGSTKKGNSYFQLHEVLSFGLNYAW
ncbi:MAG: DUF3078 domain-containing protein [Bacteroidaceae bacterium]|nr:DUF3078 domain-containing protein [Bacteroidaceae bacterium]